MTSFRNISQVGALTDVRGVWTSIVEEQNTDILHLDVTATFEWTELVWRLQGNSAPPIVLLHEKQRQPTGVLPLYIAPQSIHHVPCRRISPIAELYCGRTGFLFRHPLAEDLEAVLTYLHEELSCWDALTFTVVEGSRSSDVLTELQNQRRWPLEKIDTRVSPYMQLHDTWDDYFAALPKKFRWNLRTAEKNLKAAGCVRHREYGAGSDLARFLESMWQIERASWKEQAGSSVTARDYEERLYRQLVDVAARQGWLSGHVLELNGEPIAYVYGLLFRGVFYDLKESYNLKHKSLSPGQALKLFVLPRLYEQRVALYDYMGACEPYKMRWTDKTYTRSTYILYNRTLRGTAARVSGMLKSRLRRGAGRDGNRKSAAEEESHRW